MLVSAGIVGKLYPNHKFLSKLPQQFGNVRLVWNKCWAFLQKQYQARKQYCKHHGIDFSKMTKRQRNKAYRHLPKLIQAPSESVLDKVLTQYKRKYPWLKESDSRALQLEIKNLLKTIKHASKGLCRQPKYKSRKSYYQSYITDSNLSSKTIHNKWIKIPKLGRVRVHWDMLLKNTTVKQAIISQHRDGNYYVSLSVQWDRQPLPKTNHICGIDVGLDSLVILSNSMKWNFKYFGKANEAHKHYWEKREARRRIQAQKIIRQDKHYQKLHPGEDTTVPTLRDFKNYQKARMMVAKISRHAERQRYDYLQKLTTWLVKHFDLIAIEDIKAHQMNKNHHLARAIANASWRLFHSMLSYKCRWYGKVLEIVNKNYTSQVCHTCGMNTGKKPLKIRKFQCPYCQTVQDRDVNASINILRLGLEQAIGNNWSSREAPLTSVKLRKA